MNGGSKKDESSLEFFGVDVLRKFAVQALAGETPSYGLALDSAADEIVRLQQENERLEALLDPCPSTHDGVFGVEQCALKKGHIGKSHRNAKGTSLWSKPDDFQ